MIRLHPQLLGPALLVTAALLQTGCSSTPVLAKDIEVKVSREAAASDCKEIGSVQGQTMSSKGSQEEALSDLKKEAAHKGANYVRIEQFSGYGTAVNGTAYYCP